ncbi:hypothetical protein D3C78_1283990 [compost metagenome]
MGQGSLDGNKIEAPVIGEFLVFTGDHRHLELIGNALPGLPVTLQVNRLAVEPGLDLALDHQRRTRRRYPAQYQHQHSAAGGEPEQGADKTADNGRQHRDGLAEPNERAIIQTL